MKYRQFLFTFLCLSAQPAISSDITTLIINGSDASIRDYPSIASLYYDRIETNGEYLNYCGATILNKYFVLTAAHCVDDDKQSNLYTSVVPQMEYKSDFLNGSAITVRTKAYYYPSSFRNDARVSWPDDIAIIELVEPLNIDEADFAKLADKTDENQYRSGYEIFKSVGHGKISNDDDNSEVDQLQQTDLTIQELPCGYDNQTDKQLCMQGSKSVRSNLNNSACNGDSGGPLYWHNGFEYIQVGITSFGTKECGDPNRLFTSVYTEIADYRDWIDSVLEGNEQPKVITDEIDLSVAYKVTPMSSGGSMGLYWLMLLLVSLILRYETKK